jgi:hypothetical protein
MSDTLNLTRIEYRGYTVEIYKEGTLILNRFGVLMGEAKDHVDAKEKIDAWEDKQ